MRSGILLICFCVAGVPPLWSQDHQLVGKSLSELQQWHYTTDIRSKRPAAVLGSPFWLKPNDQTTIPDLKSAILRPSAMPIVYSYEQLAFFCRIDVQLEKSVGIPVKFRLGDVQAVEQMEKQSALVPNWQTQIPRKN